MNDDTIGLAHALCACEDVASAAERTLRHLLAVTERALESGDWMKARAARAILHLRPGQGYHGLYVLEPDAEALHAPSSGDDLAPSLSAWRTVQKTRRAVSLDVQLKALTPRGMDTEVAEDGAKISLNSQLRLERRDVTHLFAVPLFSPGELAGMVSLELKCPRGLGRVLPWESIADELELAAAIAGPYLASLPRRADDVRRDDPLLPVVGASMAGVVDVLGAFAPEPETLLVRGETGVGKSRIARWCHARSERPDGPFEVLDLLAVPEEMQMGELFGWKKGAFTGAAADHVGYVGRAQGGTLFLDEIDKLSSKAQAALLTLIEERRFRVLGSTESRGADVRFIVGTNADLPTEVREGRFREDLYYRINVLPVELPPLRERRDEIAAWARFMLERRHADKGAAGSPALDDEAAESLSRHDWPGNLRQLDNIVRRAHALASASAGDGALRVTRAHVDRAWGLDPNAKAKPVAVGDGALGALRGGAAALVDHAKDHSIDFEDVDLPRALHGVLLAEAVLRAGSREAAFELLGRGELVANRNHHKALKRDLGHALKLYAALGEDPPDDLEAL